MEITEYFDEHQRRKSHTERIADATWLNASITGDSYHTKCEISAAYLEKWPKDYVKIINVRERGTHITFAECSEYGPLVIGCINCIDPVEVHGVLEGSRELELKLEHNGSMFVVSDEEHNFKVMCGDIKFTECLIESR
jgi:hypothetical protein